ncbi:MAG: dTDP-4-dehydrorhamnose 3,5-epimerase family protein [Phycisphaeraceae bacterium]|nr:dTDP-4-dehydrorhamnose 3,5-epimerase family protein [Phycisphaeraceae bacterium]
MKITPLKIAGAAVIQSEPRGDERGAFARWFCNQELAELMGDKQIVSINHSRTEDAGAIRGMHYQREPALDMKFARCIRGEVYDVIIDLRADSPTFLQWHAERLSPQKMNMIAMPEGVAHGFQAIDPGSEMFYLHTGYYAPEYEGGVRFDDPAVGIDWPMPPTVVSQRDRSLPLLDASFRGLQA